jgi:hypothetical protein
MGYFINIIKEPNNYLVSGKSFMKEVFEYDDSGVSKFELVFNSAEQTHVKVQSSFIILESTDRYYRGKIRFSLTKNGVVLAFSESTNFYYYEKLNL